MEIARVRFLPQAERSHQPCCRLQALDEVIDGGEEDCCSAASKLTGGYTGRLGEPCASIDGVSVSAVV